MESVFFFLIVAALIIGFLFMAAQSNDQENARKINSASAIAEREHQAILKRLDRVQNQLSKEQDRLSSIQQKRNLADSIVDLQKQHASVEKQLRSTQKDLEKSIDSMRSIQHVAQSFYSTAYAGEDLFVPGFDPSSFSPVSFSDLMCMQIKDLRSLFRKNQSEIQKIVKLYLDQSNSDILSTILLLVSLGIESDIKHLLLEIKHGQLDKAVKDVHRISMKYHAAAVSCKSIEEQIVTKFIGQLEFHYIESVKIEYEYHVRKERAKEEQRALREQMRQEAEERRMLERQKKQVEAEESKYEKELLRIAEKISSAADSEIAVLKQQLEKVRLQLESVKDKKDEIVRLQNGKAGTVYVISNIGSFGEDVFKIGMTRRLEPMDRVKELGDASVPFPFDVHSFIFSEDAVALETKLHRLLNNKRVNRINLRKEFFRVSLDELQALVEECDPSAAFNRTALAEQFHQSLSVGDIPAEVISDNLEECLE